MSADWSRTRHKLAGVLSNGQVRPVDHATVVRVFLGSPGGLEDERRVIGEVIDDLNDHARRWNVHILLRSGDDHGPAGGRPQDDINPDVNRCHIFIGLLWNSLGSDSGLGVSGFEEEYRAIAARRGDRVWPRPLLWFKDVSPAQLADPGPKLSAMLSFKDELIAEKPDMFRDFANLEDLRSIAGRRIWDAIVDRTGIADPQPESLEAARGQEQPSSQPPSPPPAPGGRRVDFGLVLTAGPVSAVADGQARERQAEAIRESDPAKAAELWEDLASEIEALDEQMRPASEDLYSRASEALARAGQHDRACDLVLNTLRTRIRRGSSLVEFDIRRLADWLPEDQQWQITAWDACAEWPEGIDRAREILAQVLDLETGGEPEDRRYWLRVLAELHLLRRDLPRADAAATAVGRDARDTDTLLAALVSIEAREQRGSRPMSVDDLWEEILQWADAPVSLPDFAAITWARRGASLTRAGRLDEAHAAFDRAAVLWAQVRGAQNQVAEMYFAGQTAGYLSGVFASRGGMWRPIAVNLRGDADTPDERAGALERSGLTARAVGQGYDARRALWLALAEHRRAGNLRGELFLWHLLGELHEDAKHLDEAAAAYIAGGREDDAYRAARHADTDAIVGALIRTGPRWQRAASLAALAAVGRRLAPDQVATVSAWVLEEAASDQLHGSGPQLLPRATEALGALALLLDDTDREPALARLRLLAATPDMRVAQPAAEALMIVTNAGVSDETDVVVDVFLSNADPSRIPWLWIGERITRDHSSFPRLREAAIGGRFDAASALAVVQGVEQDVALVHLASERVRTSLAGTPGRDEDGNVIGLLSLEGLGLVGRHAAPDLRRKLLRWLTAFATSPDQPQVNRQSAANALVNLAPGVEAPHAAEAARAMTAVAHGQSERSPWDQTEQQVADPFNRIRLGFSAAAEPLRAAALEACGALCERAGEVVPGLPEAIDAAWASPSQIVAAAAWSAVGRCKLLAVPVTLPAALVHPTSRVRAAALGCVTKREVPVLSPTIVGRLLDDEAPGVRFALVQAAYALDDRDTLRRLAEDADAYIACVARISAG
jgi:hypothetical protein